MGSFLYYVAHPHGGAFAKASGIEIFDYNRRSRFGSFESVN